MISKSNHKWFFLGKLVEIIPSIYSSKTIFCKVLIKFLYMSIFTLQGCAKQCFSIIRCI